MLKRNKIKGIFIVLVIILLSMYTNLLASNVVGVWSGRNIKGSYSIKEVTIIKTEKSNNSYKMIIEWEDTCSKTRSKLIKRGEKYIQTESNVGEYQKIDSSGKLKMYDKDGLIYILPEK